MQTERKGKDRKRERRRSGGSGGEGFIFTIQWLIIGIISAIDCYWSIRLQDTLYQYEQNPLGKWLIEMGGGDVALFMMVKMIGTIVALGSLVLLYKYKRVFAHISCTCVCFFQIILLLYLTYGHTPVSQIVKF